MSSFKKDYSFGIKNEDKVLKQLNDYFEDGLISKAKDKFSKYDFEGNLFIYELKSRNNNYNAYPTTLIPADKIIKGKNQIFLFDFKDGLFYIHYTKKEFKQFKLEEFCRNKRTDYNDKKNLYYFIPIENLIKINI